MNSDIQKEKNRQFVFLKMLSVALSNNNFADFKSSMSDFVKNNKVDLNLIQKDKKPFWFSYLDNPIKRDFFEKLGINFDQKIELMGTQFPSQQSNIVIATFAETKNSNKYHKLHFDFMKKFPHLISDPVFHKPQQKVSTFYAICDEYFNASDKYYELLENILKNPELIKQCRDEKLHDFFAKQILLNFSDSIKLLISTPSYTRSYSSAKTDIENKQLTVLESKLITAQNQYSLIFDKPYPVVSYEKIITGRQGLKFYELHPLISYLEKKGLIILDENNIDKVKQSLFSMNQGYANLPLLSLLSRSLKTSGDASDNFVECGLHCLELANASFTMISEKYSIDITNEYKELLSQILSSIQTAHSPVGDKMTLQKIIEHYGNDQQKARLEKQLLWQPISVRKALKVL